MRFKSTSLNYSISSFERGLVMMAKWTHLFPYRTQKLSTSAPIVVPSGARLGHRQAAFLKNKLIPDRSIRNFFMQFYNKDFNDSTKFNEIF